MNRITHKLLNTERRKHRVRAKISGTATRPRLSVHISNKQVSAQLIDDVAQKTIASASTAGKQSKDTLTDKAVWVGGEIAKQAKSAKIKRVVFDRNGRLYHGRIKALADEARAGGLEF
jgi:large subunit ribosomal protein L18